MLGKLFWAGALAEMGDRDPREVELALHELARKELVRRSPTSSMRDESEYGFWHLLVRDVCYAQIPRAARAARHRAAAAWLERQAGERAEDLADVLAYHYLSALELTRAAGQAEEAEELEANAIRYLALAGERALRARRRARRGEPGQGARARPSGTPERAHRCSSAGRRPRCSRTGSRKHEPRSRRRPSSTASRRRASPPGAALTALAGALRATGRPARGGAARRGAGAARGAAARPRARRRLRGVGGGARRRQRLQGGDRGRRAGRSRSPPSSACPSRRARSATAARPAPRWGSHEGLEDMRRALALAVEQGQGRAAAVLHNNLALALWQYEGPQAALGCLPGGDRLLRAARHHRVRASGSPP